MVALLLGVDPGTFTAGQPTEPGISQPGFDISQCQTGKDANEIVQCRVIATGNAVDAVWTNLLGSEYERPRIQLFTGSVDTGCGAGHQ